MKFNLGAKVRTNKEYEDCFDKEFKGTIAKVNETEADIKVLVLSKCGCSRWICITWLKVQLSGCDH